MGYYSMRSATTNKEHVNVKCEGKCYNKIKLHKIIIELKIKIWKDKKNEE